MEPPGSTRFLVVVYRVIGVSGRSLDADFPDLTAADQRQVVGAAHHELRQRTRSRGVFSSPVGGCAYSNMDNRIRGSYTF